MFETHAWPADVSRVLAVWRNVNTGKIVFQETESILPSAASNYVWLQVNDGWPSGNWQLDIFDPFRHFSLLASGTFNIQ